MSTGIHQAMGIPFAAVDGVDIRLPKVSVVIGNYNQGQFLPDAIRSVAAQTYPNLECIVVDDCSTDDSVRIIRSTLDALGDSRFRFVPREINGGQMAAMYTGLDASAGAFVAFLDADDIWLPSFLETHIACHLNPEINAAMSSSNLAVIDAEGTLVAGSHPSFSHHSPGRDRSEVARLDVPKLRHSPADRGASPPKIIFVRSNYHSWLWSPTSGLVFRRVVLDVIRPEIDEDFRTCADTYLARFAHLLGGSIIVHEVHGYYRIHGGNSYAKHTVFGDHARAGAAPAHVDATAKTKIIEKLCADPLFSRVMREEHLGETLMQLVKRPSEVDLVLKSRSLRGAVSRRHWRGLRRRRLKLLLKGLFASGSARRG